MSSSCQSEFPFLPAFFRVEYFLIYSFSPVSSNLDWRRNFETGFLGFLFIFFREKLYLNQQTVHYVYREKHLLFLDKKIPSGNHGNLLQCLAEGNYNKFEKLQHIFVFFIDL